MTRTRTIKKRPADVQAARNTLRRKGWSQISAAAVLEVTPEHLCYVLNGRRQSRRILAAIDAMPSNPNPA